MLKTKPLSYTLNDKNFIGHLAYDSAFEQKRPAVLVIPTWMGLNDFIRHKAEALTALGYVGYAVDLFGEGAQAKSVEEAKERITPLATDRQIIRDRLQAAFQTLSTHPLVEAPKVAAIGFCFGGLCVLELAKSGCDLPGVVSFHGILGNPSDLPMKALETASKIRASILLLQGYKDTLSPEGDLLRFEKEMSERGTDWQAVVYGDAMHAFTNPTANLPEKGLQYHELTSNRAWLAMQNFLTEIFSR